MSFFCLFINKSVPLLLLLLPLPPPPPPLLLLLPSTLCGRCGGLIPTYPRASSGAQHTAEPEVDALRLLCARVCRPAGKAKEEAERRARAAQQFLKQAGLNPDEREWRQC